jgi:hypothetical protein
MASFLYRCPITGSRVQGWVADNPTDDDSYEAVSCKACAGVHAVNPKTGKVLGGDDDLASVRRGPRAK